jgi:DNA invertase Pin-like site-specific DNA recombinase
LTVAIYARVSTDDQSCDEQVERLERWCHVMGMGPRTVFRDDGVSGIRDNRPELDKMRLRIREGKIRTVVVSKIDRLGRSLGMILRFWDEADAVGCRVVVVDQAIDTSTPAGRLQRNMLAAVAEFERDLIKERTDAGIARARRAGKKFGRPVMYPPQVADEVLNRWRGGQSLRAISSGLGIKLGGVRSILRRRDQSPPLKPEGSYPGVDRGA